MRPQVATVGCCLRQQHFWSHRNPYSRPEAAIFSYGRRWILAVFGWFLRFFGSFLIRKDKYSIENNIDLIAILKTLLVFWNHRGGFWPFLGVFWDFFGPFLIRKDKYSIEKNIDLIAILKTLLCFLFENIMIEIHILIFRSEIMIYRFSFLS